MKTIKKIIIIIVVVSIVAVCAVISKQSVNEIKSSLHESTHQGYRTMVADFIF